MAKYGNILTIYNPRIDTFQNVELILNNNQIDYLWIDSHFFLQSNSKVNTSDVVRALKDLDIEFFFFHNHDATGSFLWHKGKTNGDVEKVKSLLKIQ